MFYICIIGSVYLAMVASGGAVAAARRGVEQDTTQSLSTQANMIWSRRQERKRTVVKKLSMIEK